MLADQDTAVVDQLVGRFFFSSLIIPGTSEGNFHGSGRAHGAGTQEEGCVAGNNLCIGVSADITDLGFIFLDIAVFDHLVELHACSNACKITAFIDGGKCVVIVGKVLGMSLGACRVAELDFREFLCSLDHEILMAEGVRKDDVAAGISQIARCIIAFLSFRDIGLDDAVFFADVKLLTNFLCSCDEVIVIGGVLIMQHDEAYLDIACRQIIIVSDLFSCVCNIRVIGLFRLCNAAAATAACQNAHGKNQCEYNTQCLFHFFPPFNFCGKADVLLSYRSYENKFSGILIIRKTKPFVNSGQSYFASHHIDITQSSQLSHNAFAPPLISGNRSYIKIRFRFPACSSKIL